jgi:hypothetical protein
MNVEKGASTIDRIGVVSKNSIELKTQISRRSFRKRQSNVKRRLSDVMLCYVLRPTGASTSVVTSHSSLDQTYRVADLTA